MLNTYVYNEINELLSWKEAVSGKTNTYSYDDNGNMTCINDNSGKIKEFKYNTLNQLIEYKDNQGTDVCYNYNAESLRSCKYYATNSVRRISYYYNQNGSVINEEDERGQMTSYLIAGDRVLRAVIPSTVNGQQLTDNVSWYIKNGKDVIATIDNSQKNTNIYNYNAYGEDTDLNKQGKVVPKKNSFDINDNPYKYSGYYYDEESGMYYCQARYYSPELMRFISRDTYDLSNRYAYCDGDPISNVDPNGHMSQAANWAITGVAIAGAIMSLIFSFGAASPLAIGLGIAGGLLGLGSAGTQAGSMATTGKTSETLSYISLGLGIGGAVADLAGIGVTAFAKAGAAAKGATKIANPKFEEKVNKAVSYFEADLKGVSRKGIQQEILSKWENTQDISDIYATDWQRTMRYGKKGQAEGFISDDSFGNTPAGQRLIVQDTRLVGGRPLTLARVNGSSIARGSLLETKTGINCVGNKIKSAFYEDSQLGIGVKITARSKGGSYIPQVKYYRVNLVTSQNELANAYFERVSIILRNHLGI